MNHEANVKQVVPFLGVSNMEASIRFYVDGLGFEITNRWIDEGKLRWCWLQLGGAYPPQSPTDVLEETEYSQ